MATKKVILVEGTESKQVTVSHSPKWSLTARDWMRSLVMAAASAAVMALYKAFDKEGDVFHADTLIQVGKAAAGGALAYLSTKFPADTKIVKVEEK